jgi:hypothetical protein
LYGGDDPEQAQKLADRYGVELCDTEEEVIEKADAIAITYRKGSMHYAPAMKVLKAGKPLFNDKPFALGVQESLSLTDYARKNGLLLTGGTNLKGLPEIAELKSMIGSGSTVYISFAADRDSEYDGYWFYGIHSAELCVALCGENYLNVTAMPNGNALLTVVQYADKQCVIANSPGAHDLKIAVSHGGETLCKKVIMNYQSVGPKELVNMVKSGTLPRPLTHYEKSVELVERIIESCQKN